MYKRVTQRFILILIVILSLIVNINFFVDPGKIYFKKILSEQKVKNFAEAIFKSSNGIYIDDINIRMLKMSLINNSDSFHCILFGSSRVQQISTIRQGSIASQCKSLLNLGVSGAILNDIVIFSHEVLTLNYKPKIFIGIDPWMLKLGGDPRWGLYKEVFLNMQEASGFHGLQKRSSYDVDLLKNLLNFDYTMSSFKTLIKSDQESIKKADEKTISKNYRDFNVSLRVEFAEKFDYEIGGKEEVLLGDGSHVYASSYISRKKNSTIPLGEGYYKILDEPYTDEGIELLNRVINMYLNKSIEVNFVLMPYHPNVFKKGQTKSVEHIIIVENKIREIAAKKNLKVYGSYFSDVLNCQENEFFDEMHPTIECTNRIKYE